MQWLVEEAGRVCEKRKLRVNVEKSKVLKCGTDGTWGNMEIKLNGVN